MIQSSSVMTVCPALQPRGIYSVTVCFSHLSTDQKKNLTNESIISKQSFHWSRTIPVVLLCVHIEQKKYSSHIEFTVTVKISTFNNKI